MLVAVEHCHQHKRHDTNEEEEAHTRCCCNILNILQILIQRLKNKKQQHPHTCLLMRRDGFLSPNHCVCLSLSSCTLTCE
mmetsp:Transcript_33977/g.39600  ORF Transcript_33977/g.39600 Transcript_33977/m.39600 type:complete len:80 (+) Transcript_33977:250-489(+)